MDLKTACKIGVYKGLETTREAVHNVVAFFSYSLDDNIKSNKELKELYEEYSAVGDISILAYLESIT